MSEHQHQLLQNNVPTGERKNNEKSIPKINAMWLSCNLFVKQKNSNNIHYTRRMYLMHWMHFFPLVIPFIDDDDVLESFSFFSQSIFELIVANIKGKMNGKPYAIHFSQSKHSFIH